MPVPNLPKFQDCHELWSKKRRRQMREQNQIELQKQHSSNSAPNSEKMDDNSVQ